MSNNKLDKQNNVYNSVTSVSSSADGQLDIDADTEDILINMRGTINVDINGDVEIIVYYSDRSSNFLTERCIQWTVCKEWVNC